MLDELFYPENRWKLWTIMIVLALVALLSWYAHWTISDYAKERLSFAEDTWKWWIGHKYVRMIFTTLTGTMAALLLLSHEGR